MATLIFVVFLLHLEMETGLSWLENNVSNQATLFPITALRLKCQNSRIGQRYEVYQIKRTVLLVLAEKTLSQFPITLLSKKKKKNPNYTNLINRIMRCGSKQSGKKTNSDFQFELQRRDDLKYIEFLYIYTYSCCVTCVSWDKLLIKEIFMGHIAHKKIFTRQFIKPRSVHEANPSRFCSSLTKI